MERLFHECADDEEWYLASPLSPDDCVERLRSVLLSSSADFSGTYVSSPRFGGSASDGRFQVRLAGNGAAFIAYGRLDLSSSGTSVVVEINRTAEGWLVAGLVALFLLIALAVGLPNPGIGHALWILLATAGVIGLPVLWAWEKKRLTDFIFATLDAKPERVLLTGMSTGW